MRLLDRILDWHEARTRRMVNDALRYAPHYWVGDHGVATGGNVQATDFDWKQQALHHCNRADRLQDEVDRLYRYTVLLQDEITELRSRLRELEGVPDGP